MKKNVTGKFLNFWTMVAVAKAFFPLQLLLKFNIDMKVFSVVGNSTLSCVKASWMWPSPQCSL